MGVDYQLIGARIKELRNKLGFTQAQLAEKVGLSAGHVSAAERGINNLSLNLLAGFADAFNCGVVFLISGAELPDNNRLVEEFNEDFAGLNTADQKLVLDIVGRLKYFNFNL